MARLVHLFLEPGRNYITTEQYEAISKALVSRAVVGASEPGDSILAEMLLNAKSHYYEALAINSPEAPA